MFPSTLAMIIFPGHGELFALPSALNAPHPGI
jgi:hypothetical protein